MLKHLFDRIMRLFLLEEDKVLKLHPIQYRTDYECKLTSDLDDMVDEKYLCKHYMTFVRNEYCPTYYYHIRTFGETVATVSVDSNGVIKDISLIAKRNEAYNQEMIDTLKEKYIGVKLICDIK